MNDFNRLSFMEIDHKEKSISLDSNQLLNLNIRRDEIIFQSKSYHGLEIWRSHDDTLFGKTMALGHDTV